MKVLRMITATVLGIAVISVVLLFQAQRSKSQQDYLIFLQSLRGNNITKIVLSDDKGLSLDSISAPVALDAFAQAANTAEPYLPNHPSYTKDYFVELYLTDGLKREFQFHTLPADQIIYVDFVERIGTRVSYYGNCKSVALFDWLKKQTSAAQQTTTTTQAVSD